MSSPIPPPFDPSRGTHRARRWVAGVRLVATLAAVGVALARRPPAAPEPGSRTGERPAPLGVLGIARQLADLDVIRSQVGFVGLAVARGAARSLKAVEYEVSQGAPLLAVLQLLETGRV